MIRDETQLGTDARAVIEAARAGEDPPAGTQQRVLTGVTAAVLMGTAAATLGSASAATATAAGAKLSGWAMKLAFAGVGLGVTGVAGVASLKALRPEGERPSARAETIPPVREATRHTVSGTARGDGEAADRNQSDVSLAPGVPASTRRMASARKAILDATSARVETLRGETTLLRAAQLALRDGEAERALTYLTQHAKAYPAGVLLEERAATRVLALCDAGRMPEARQEARTFLAQWPRSPQAARVRNACPDDRPNSR